MMITAQETDSISDLNNKSIEQNAFHKLEFKASPKRKNKKEWVCSLLCKNERNEVQTFTTSQNTEKHIMRKHPDPEFRNFVCLICGWKNVSPQQILDHLAQKKEKKGHEIKDKITKDSNIRAIETDTGTRYRFSCCQGSRNCGILAYRMGGSYRGRKGKEKFYQQGLEIVFICIKWIK